MRLAGLAAALVVLLVLAACAPNVPLAGQAHTAMGGGSGCTPPSQDPSAMAVRFTLSSGSWGSFGNLKGAGIDASGRLFVPDGDNNNIRVFNAATGAHIRTLTAANGQSYTDPRYVVEGPSGRIYISDRGNNRFVVLDSALNFLFQSPGGQFSGIEGLAVDSNGDIYALDGSNNNIKRFDANGQNPAVVVSSLSFSTDHLALHPGRNELLVNDATNDVVRRYDKTTGAARGSISGFADSPEGLAIDRNGRLYVAVANARVRIFDSAYTYLHSFNAPGMTTGGTDGLAFNAASDAFAIINDAAGAMRAIVLDGSNVEGLTWCPCTDGDGDGYFADAGCTPSGDCNDGNAAIHPAAPDVCGNGVDEDCDGVDVSCTSCTTDNDGDGYGIDPGCVRRDCNDLNPDINPGRAELCGNGLDDNCNSQTDEATCCSLPAADPVALTSIFASDGGGLSRTQDVDIDSQGNILVADDGRESVMAYSATGTFLREIGPAIPGLSGLLNNPEYLAVAPDGTIYVSDRSNTRVVILNADYTYRGVFGTPGGGNGQFNQPQGIAVAPNGDVFVADHTNDNIQRFTRAGAFLNTVVVGLSFPTYLILDAQRGELIVAQDGNGHVERFSLATFASLGFIAPSYVPFGLAVDQYGRLYVADRASGLIHVYERPSTLLHTFTVQGGLSSRPRGIAYDAARNLFVLGNDDQNTPLVRVVGLRARDVEAITTCSCTDADTDAYYLEPACNPGGDCDDSAAGINPGALEACDNADQDCDGAIDESLTQNANCGVGACQATAAQTCTAGAWLPACTPGSSSPETCNSADDDCDGQTDEGLSQQDTCGIGPCQTTVSQTCSAGVWAPVCIPTAPTPEICGNSIDEDCDGADAACPPGCTTDGDNDGYKMESACGATRDCDDANPAIHPGAAERCGNSADDNCDGAIDEAGCCTAAPETCDNTDNDCDGQTDEGLSQPQTCGVGACQVTVTQSCSTGAWLPACTPGGPGTETCGNGVDEDCDGADAACPPGSGGSPLFSKGGGGGGGGGFLRERTTTLKFDSDLYQGTFMYKGAQPIVANVTPARPLTLPRRAVYKYLMLNTSTVQDLRSVTLFFRVPLSWLEDEQVPPLTIRLYSYDRGWREMTTNQFAGPTETEPPCTGLLCTIGKAFLRLMHPNEYAYYSAAAFNTGLFAIAGTSSASSAEPQPLPAEPPLPPPPSQPNASLPPAVATETPAAAPPAEEAHDYYILVGLLVLALVGLFVVFVVRRAHHARLADIPGTDLLALTQWITNCRDSGYTDPQIRSRLRSVGWVEAVLNHYLKR